MEVFIFHMILQFSLKEKQKKNQKFQFHLKKKKEKKKIKKRRKKDKKVEDDYEEFDGTLLRERIFGKHLQVRMNAYDKKKINKNTNSLNGKNT